MHSKLAQSKVKKTFHMFENTNVSRYRQVTWFLSARTKNKLSVASEHIDCLMKTGSALH
jgi:hypothetical protein